MVRAGFGETDLERWYENQSCGREVVYVGGGDVDD